MKLPDGVTGHYRQNKLVFEIDIHKTEYKGRIWKNLSTFDKRKFENTLFLSHPKDQHIFLYV